MRFPLLVVVFTLFGSCVCAQKKPAADIWSGSYEVFPNKDAKPEDTTLIKKTDDIATDKVAYKYEADLARWQIISTRDSKKEAIIVRRFLSNDDDNEYKEFGWTDLHKSGKMNCIDGGHFFICKTEPDTSVEVKGDKPFKTESGIFGVWLHYGLVTLKKIN